MKPLTFSQFAGSPSGNHFFTSAAPAAARVSAEGAFIESAKSSASLPAGASSAMRV